MSLAPLMSVGLAWIFFGENLTGMQMLSVIVTLAGMAWRALRCWRGVQLVRLLPPKRKTELLYRSSVLSLTSGNANY